MIEKLKSAKEASKVLGITAPSKINKALENISQELINNIDYILKANEKDILAAQERGISKAMIDRLLLTKDRIESISKDVLKIREINFDVDKVLETFNTKEGLLIEKVRVPFGVIGAIYEARPNVSVDIAVLCLKTKNACVLKGGSEALNSNKAIVEVMHKAIKDILPIGVITFIDDTNRDKVLELIKAKEYLDLVVPRGGENLINFVVANSLVPVIETGAGICHIYVEKEADLCQALKIVHNAKTSRPSVCNAVETILIDEAISKEFLPQLKDLFTKSNVIIKGCKKTQEIIECEEALEKDFATEHLDLIVNVKVVKGFDEAVNHILTFSTKHSDAIITENEDVASNFLNLIDSACVYHNASTRFTDGGCFGFGAELGISTQKLHARGPMALVEMTTYKYKIYGKGQIR
ncbi:MAG: glutamate-5-semialdehyde dehydrogenase [Bacilli bacterium]|jgi:glutamate-5-semialdehyde dehydrogenase